LMIYAMPWPANIKPNYSPPLAIAELLQSFLLFI